MSEQYFHITSGHWASKGREPLYDWFASTNFYSSKLFSQNEYSLTCNAQVERNRNRLGQFWDIILSQLKNEPVLLNHNLIRVLNTDVIDVSNQMSYMLGCFKSFFGETKDLIQDGRLNPSGLNGKTLVLPFVFREPRVFRTLEGIIPVFKNNCGVAKVIVIYACNLVPSGNRYIEPQDFPFISENAFSQAMPQETLDKFKDLLEATPAQDTFRRRSTPINLKGTTWKSDDPKLTLSFDKNSANGASYNGIFATYDYDTSRAQISLFFMDEFCMGESILFKVNSITPEIMDITCRNGRVRLKKVSYEGI